MSKMFAKTSINGMELENRFVRSATYEGMATTDGAVTYHLIDTMRALAKGGVGLIITSHAYVLQDGQAAPRQLGIYKDDLIKGLQDMTKAVHEQGSKIIMQIAHAGKAAIVKTPLLVSKLDESITPKGKEIEPAELSNLVKAFAEAARRAKAAGFDGVEVHCAHGYLLSQFLTPYLNRRQDQYGGSIENRTRIHVQIIRAIRAEVGTDFPVLIKLNSQDFIESGLSAEDALLAAKILTEAGIDAIELSGGVITGKLSPSRVGIKTESDEAYFQNEARTMKQLIDIPLILVGGMRSFQVAERLVESETADYVSLCRPLIREPELINRWKSGDMRRSLCISCNKCFKTLVSEQGVYCAVDVQEKNAASK